MDLSTVGLFDNPRAPSPRPKRRHEKRLRGPKLVAAFAFAVLVGSGSYAASYKALVLISTSPAASGSVAPTTSKDATITTLSAPAQLPG